MGKTLRWNRLVLSLCIASTLLAVGYRTEQVYAPGEVQVLRPDLGASEGSEANNPAYDLWGREISQQEANKLLKTEKGRAMLSPKNGAVKIDDALIQLGRKAFYEETFGNEVFITDIVGAFEGPVSMASIKKAIEKLEGKGTSNLRIQMNKTVTVGGKTFAKGSWLDTGLDVPKGSNEILGLPFSGVGGQVKAGITCAACHATVDPVTKLVVEGAPNADLNAGLLMAMASNSAAYFTHTDISSLREYLHGLTVETSDGKTARLPDPESLEAAVDANLMKWPKGNFDSTIDMKSNPSQIPDSFTSGDFPFGWSGHAMAGSFKGLSTFNNNVHAQNSDSLTQSEVSRELFGIDKEVYIGTILQNAPNQKYRYTAANGQKPSEFFAKVDPTPGAPGVNEVIKPPSFPKATLVAPDGLIVSSPGTKVNEQNNAMSAWQNTLVPPKPRIESNPEAGTLGRGVFQRAGCISCHAGDAFTNHRIIPAPEIGTDPSRARALKATEKIWGEALIHSPDTPVPIPEGADVLKVPTEGLEPEQIKLAFAKGDSPGGYKTPSLIGLYWTAPYLHDGGVAVGRDPRTQLGVPGTLAKGIQPDPANSLRALVDRELREKVIAANREAGLKEVHVQGIGHEYWVDSSKGFDRKEQDALISYLLSLESRGERHLKKENSQK
jgi:hypothetical protein